MIVGQSYSRQSTSGQRRFFLKWLDISHFFLFHQKAVNLEQCSQQLHYCWSYCLPAWLESFCLPCLKSNYYVGWRPHHDEPVRTSFEKMWKLQNRCGKHLSNKDGNNLCMSIVHADMMLCGLLLICSKSQSHHTLLSFTMQQWIAGHWN